ncbi:MAG TPA: DUF2630 family protein [Mycobacteriales bacterium]|jgi:uncharacterized protein YajQ (UPF0234 family)|nr:DUF2630 family protein [Mycobacteriales bacterium]
MASPDQDLLSQIDAAIAEEHDLRARHRSVQGLTEDESTRMTHLEQHLDQLWDLLRQRRAKRDVGADPGEASERPADVVEQYRS